MIERLKKWRKILWRALSGDPETSWVAHFFLVFAGSLIPSALVAWLWSERAGLITGFVFSELWLLFMSGREVSDYLRKIWAKEPPKAVVRDGLGDLVGPLLNHLIWWAALASILGG